MTTRNWLSNSILAALLTSFAASAAVASPASGRLQLSVGPVLVSRQNDAVLTKTQIVEAGMLHRFQIEVVNADGSAVSSKTGWVVEIALSGSGCAPACLRFTADMKDVSLPRPLGLRVLAGDVVTVSASFTAGYDAAEPLFVRINVEYDTTDAGLMRFAVTPFAARAGMARGDSQRTWEWSAPADARLLALAGPAVAAARDLVLEDVQTGAVVWRTSNRGAPLAFASSNAHVRLGAALVAGRSYRLTASYEQDAPAGDAPVIMLARLRD